MLDGFHIYDENRVRVLSFPVGGTVAIPIDFVSYIPAELSVEDWSRFIEVSPGQFLYFEKYGRLYLALPCGADSPPLLVEEVLKHVVTAMESFFRQPLTASLVNEHGAEIVLLLSQMLGAGFPGITEPDILRQLVYKESFLSKLVGNPLRSDFSGQSAVGAASQGEQTPSLLNNIVSHRIPDPLIPWEYPWRRSRVKHNKEELFVDIIEHAKIISQSKDRLKSHFASTIITNLRARVQINGEVKLLSRLSGAPKVTIDLANASLAALRENARIHQCVDYEKFMSSKGLLLTFVPADLDSVVMKYSTKIDEQGLVIVDLQRHVAKNGSGDKNEGSFHIRVSTSIDTTVEHVSDLTVQIVFPATAKTVKEIGATSGELDASNPQKCDYRFQKNVPMGWNASLHAMALDADGEPVQPLYIEAKYSLVGRVFSGVSVKTIRISTSNSRDPMPFKGVRYQTLVDSYIVT